MSETHLCESPQCVNFVSVDTEQRHYFCDECRERCSYHTLLIQLDYNKKIEDLILEAARMFRKQASAAHMAAYIGVSFVTMYNWLRKYFDMTFQEFRRAYICKSSSCYTINIRRSSYSRHDYVLKKIRSQRYCACVNALDEDTITTNASLSVIKDIFRGNPKIEKITDSYYALVTDPVDQTEVGVHPIYDDRDPVYNTDF